MATGKTARRSLKFPKTIDSFVYCADFQAFAEALDHDAETGQGTQASRPAAKTAGRLFATVGDPSLEKANILYWDTGAVWTGTPALMGKGNTYQISELEDGATYNNPSTTRSQFIVIAIKWPPNPAGQSLFELKINGVSVDPNPFLGEGGISFYGAWFFLPPNQHFTCNMNFYEEGHKGHFRVAALEL